MQKNVQAKSALQQKLMYDNVDKKKVKARYAEQKKPHLEISLLHSLQRVIEEMTKQRRSKDCDSSQLDSTHNHRASRDKMQVTEITTKTSNVRRSLMKNKYSEGCYDDIDNAK